jgi:hypothetical protein
MPPNIRYEKDASDKKAEADKIRQCLKTVEAGDAQRHEVMGLMMWWMFNDVFLRDLKFDKLQVGGD